MIHLGQRMLTQRPPDWKITARPHPFKNGMVFFGGGRLPNEKRYFDSSLGLNHGTLTNFSWPNTVTSGWQYAPQLGRMGQTTKQHDRITFATFPTLNTFSISWWQRGVAGAAGGECVFSWKANYAGIFSYQSSGNMVLVLSAGSASKTWTAAIPDMTYWHAYTYTQAGVSASSWVELFRDGVSLGGQLKDTSTVQMNRMIIGGCTDVNYDYVGTLSDLLVHDNPLAVSEIQSLADPSNTMLRCGGVDLIEPLWPRVFAAAVAGGTPYTATGACTAKRAVAAGSGTSAVPVYSGAGSASAPRATAAGAGTHVAPTYTAAGACTIARATAAGVGTSAVPVYTGIGAATAAKATAAGAGTSTVPVFTGAGAAAAPKATAAGAGTATVPTYAGLGAATARRATAIGLGVFTAPTYIGSGAVVCRRATAEGSGQLYLYLYTGLGALVCRQAICSGVGGYTPKASIPYVVAARAMFLPGAQKGSVFLPGAVAGCVESQ